MAKSVRYEFLGSWVFFTFCCIFFFWLPTAFLYWKTRSIRIEEEIEDPEEFVKLFRAGKLKR